MLYHLGLVLLLYSNFKNYQNLRPIHFLWGTLKMAIFQSDVHGFQKVALWNIIQEGLKYRKTQGNQKRHEVSIHPKIGGGAPRLLPLVRHGPRIDKTHIQ